jgi:hypothetical protein
MMSEYLREVSVVSWGVASTSRFAGVIWASVAHFFSRKFFDGRREPVLYFKGHTTRKMGERACSQELPFLLSTNLNKIVYRFFGSRQVTENINYDTT